MQKLIQCLKYLQQIHKRQADRIVYNHFLDKKQQLFMFIRQKQALLFIYMQNKSRELVYNVFQALKFQNRFNLNQLNAIQKAKEYRKFKLLKKALKTWKKRHPGQKKLCFFYSKYLYRKYFIILKEPRCIQKQQNIKADLFKSLINNKLKRRIIEILKESIIQSNNCSIQKFNIRKLRIYFDYFKGIIEHRKQLQSKLKYGNLKTLQKIFNYWKHHTRLILIKHTQFKVKDQNYNRFKRQSQEESTSKKKRRQHIKLEQITTTRTTLGQKSQRVLFSARADQKIQKQRKAQQKRQQILTQYKNLLKQELSQLQNQINTIKHIQFQNNKTKPLHLQKLTQQTLLIKTQLSP